MRTEEGVYQWLVNDANETQQVQRCAKASEMIDARQGTKESGEVTFPIVGTSSEIDNLACCHTKSGSWASSGARGNSVEEYNSIDKDETLSSSRRGFPYVRNRKVDDEENRKEV